MGLTREQWKKHLGVTGWRHEDGTVCPTTLAPAKHERLWCTEHQQYVIAPETPPDAIDGGEVA